MLAVCELKEITVRTEFHVVHVDVVKVSVDEMPNPIVRVALAMYVPKDLALHDAPRNTVPLP